MDFKGKVVLLTGAASGIGLETARNFAGLNASLVLVDRKNINHEYGRDALVIQADLKRDEDILRVVRETVNTFGRLDVLLNIAGIGITGDIQSTTMEMYDRIMGVNLRAVYHLTRACVPHLIQSKGCIVNVSSVYSKIIFTNALVYSIAKAGVDHLTKSLAVELAPSGVRVNAINPGLVLTPMMTYVLGDEIDSFVKKNEDSTPLGRLGTTKEMARAMAFLASNETASYITGVTLSVDGGRALAAIKAS